MSARLAGAWLIAAALLFFLAWALMPANLHHRGQLTTLLMQAGVDPGVTDLIWLPDLQGQER